MVLRTLRNTQTVPTPNCHRWWTVWICWKTAWHLRFHQYLVLLHLHLILSLTTVWMRSMPLVSCLRHWLVKERITKQWKATRTLRRDWVNQLTRLIIPQKHWKILWWASMRSTSWMMIPALEDQVLDLEEAVQLVPSIWCRWKMPTLISRSRSKRLGQKQISRSWAAFSEQKSETRWIASRGTRSRKRLRRLGRRWPRSSMGPWKLRGCQMP